MSGEGFDPMSADPNLGAGIGNMAEDPNAGMPAEGEPGMEGADAGIEDPALGGEAEGGIGDDSTASIIDQLSDDDKEAVRNYAESLLNRDEAVPGDEANGMEEPAAPGQEQGVMMEITKGRLKKVQRKLSETFRGNLDVKDETEKKQKKVNNDFKKKTPFDTPLD
jgi:hypothetical protein